MKTDISNIVNCGDQICATLECNGRRLASVNGMNFNSLEAVKRALLDMAGRYVGMAVLTVRNCTCGWRDGPCHHAAPGHAPRGESLCSPQWCPISHSMGILKINVRGIVSR